MTSPHTESGLAVVLSSAHSEAGGARRWRALVPTSRPRPAEDRSASPVPATAPFVPRTLVGLRCVRTYTSGSVVPLGKDAPSHRTGQGCSSVLSGSLRRPPAAPRPRAARVAVLIPRQDAVLRLSFASSSPLSRGCFNRPVFNFTDNDSCRLRSDFSLCHFLKNFSIRFLV